MQNKADLEDIAQTTVVKQAQQRAFIMQNITQLENDIWESASQLQANASLTANEYSMPVLGLIFLLNAKTR
jgi:hypothetical protein